MRARAINGGTNPVSRLDVQRLGFCGSTFSACVGININTGLGLGRLSLKVFEWKKGKGGGWKKGEGGGGGSWRRLDVRRISFRVVDVFGVSG